MRTLIFLFLIILIFVGSVFANNVWEAPLASPAGSTDACVVIWNQSNTNEDLARISWKEHGSVGGSGWQSISYVVKKQQIVKVCRKGRDPFGGYLLFPNVRSDRDYGIRVRSTYNRPLLVSGFFILNGQIINSGLKKIE